MPTEHSTGIDVSHFQGTINWPKVKIHGHDFVAIKATQGQSHYRDAPYYTNNIQQARNAGLIAGAYHFFTGGDDGAKQAHYFLSIADPKPGDLLPMLDLEQTNGAHAHEIATEALAFLETVEKSLGRKPFLYTTHGFWTQIGNPSGFSDYPLWVAEYTSRQPRLPKGWSNYEIWQNSQTGTCPGIAGDVDTDQMRAELTSFTL